MKRFYILLFTILFTVLIAEISEATNIDSLRAELKILENEDKIHTLINLSRAILYNDPIEAQDFCEEALELSQVLHIDSLIVYSYIYLGLSYNFLDQWRISNDYLLKALEYEYAKTNSYIHGTILTNLAINYDNLNQWEKAAKYNFESIVMFENRNDSLSMAHSLSNLGLLYFNMGNFEESIKQIDTALEIFQKFNHKIYIARNYSALSDSYFKMGEIEKGKQNFLEAEKVFKNADDEMGLSELYYFYAENLFLNKKYHEALLNYDMSLKHCDTVATPMQYYMVLLGKGRVYLYLGNTNKAKELLYEAKAGFEITEYETGVLQATLDLAKLYAKKADWNKFNEYYDLYEDNKNAELKEKEKNTVTELNLLYQTEKKNNQIEIQEIEIASQKNKVLLLSIVVVLFFGGLVIVVGASKKLKGRNSELFRKNKELSKRWNELQGFYMKCTPPEDETKESKTLFQNIIKLFNDEKIYRRSDLTVDYLAKHFSSNVKYISSSIKDQTGMNFNTFVNTYRIEDAKSILREKKSINLTLEAIGEECGFNNQTSFYQAFKKNTGLTPSQYRQVGAA